MSRIYHAAERRKILSVAPKASCDRLYGLVDWYDKRGDPWGKNPTVFNSGKYTEPVEPVITGLFRTQRFIGR